MNKENIFYDYQKVLSYNALLNILIGERGVGKTYGFKKYVINRFLKKGKQFVYIRRYDSDLEESVGNTINNKFFSQVVKEFPGHTFKITKAKKVRTLFIDDKICGFALPLSAADSLKSSSYDNVDIICYDEFMLKEGSTQRYLKDEPETILDIIETVGRLRDIKIFLLGNAINSYSPIFQYFDLSLPYNTDIKLFKDGLILVNYIRNIKYREVKKASKFGRLIDGTKYGEYAIDNDFLMDNKAFIHKKPSQIKFLFRFKSKGTNYGVWYAYGDMGIYFSFDYDPNSKTVLSFDNESHDQDTILVTSKSNAYMQLLTKKYHEGKLYFESQKIKTIIMEELFKFLI